MRLLVTAVIATGLVLVGCGGSEDETAGSAQGARTPWGMTFVASEITRSGDRVDLIAETELEVSFQEAIDRPGRSDTTQGVRWRAGCNHFGAPAEISGRELILAQVMGTEIGCPPARARQDRWVSDFFSNDPTLELEGDRLTLRSGDTAIRFTRRPR